MKHTTSKRTGKLGQGPNDNEIMSQNQSGGRSRYEFEGGWQAEQGRKRREGKCGSVGMRKEGNVESRYPLGDHQAHHANRRSNNYRALNALRRHVTCSRQPWDIYMACVTLY